ncbi:MAG: zinc-ribbon domain-containing protein, partial [Gammaproteobacteria bacterium]|nr:zinc-ribbon domain-containing protein [Gammaproteobacteria bacterium]
MYTHCPNCDTHFEITQEYLNIANGKVRCGKCDHIFNALDNLCNRPADPDDNSDI